MAITILKRPQPINPNSNNNIWEISSNINTLSYFTITLINPVDNNILINQKHYPKPMSNRVVINLSSILKDISESVLSNINDMISYTSIPAYKIIITEYINNNGTIVAGDTLVDANVNYFFEAKENELDYIGYGSNKYNINSTTKAKFLTHNKVVKTITSKQKEYLKIFNTNNLAKKLSIKCYDEDGDLIVEVKLPIANNNSVINLNVSPNVILNNATIKAHEEALFIQQYKISILNDVDAELSESRLYKMVDKICYLKETNILYKNSIGGWDSIVFNNRVENIAIDKKYYVKDNTYSNQIFSTEKENLSTTATTTYSASSDLLDDFESKQIKELLLSNRVYVVLGNYLIEVTIDNKTYKVLQRHVNGFKKNRLELLFSTPFSIEQLEDTVSIEDVGLNDDPDSYTYLTATGDYVIDSFLNDIILRY